MKIGLVGATNVGKSTLFNRLIGQFRAIVTDIAGTTRDIIQHSTELDGLGQVIFSDSPGLGDFESEKIFINKIIDESDLLLFLVDDEVGLTSKEQDIAEYIRKKNKQNQTLLVVNKLDLGRKTSQSNLAISEYYRLGFDHVVGISAKTGRNLDELKSFIIKLGKKIAPSSPVSSNFFESKNAIALAILGKPNAGKSTLLNTLVGKQLSKVEDKAGTTRDYIIGSFTYDGQHYLLYDTAGIKKKGSMHAIEKIAYQKTFAMLKFVRPIVLFLIDASQGISHRDMTLLQEINRIGLAVIVALNKIDLVDKKSLDDLFKTVQASLNFAKYLPIFPLVAKTGEGISDIMTSVQLIKKEMHKRIDTNKLNKVLNKEYISRPPRFPKNKICKILYITQTDVDAPTFVVFVNHKERANFAFKQWIENSLRKHFKFVGTPLIIKFKERNEKENV